MAVAGDVDHDDIVAEVAAAFADLPAGDGRIARTRPGGAGRERRSIDDDSEQVHLAFGGRALRRDHPDREALDVVNHVFGGGLSSRLFDEIRERRGPRLQRLLGDVGLRRHRRLVGVRRGDARARRRGAPAGRWTSSIGSSPTASPTTSWRSPSATSPAPTRWASRTPAARMGRLGGMLATLGKVHTVEEQLARWERVSLDDVKRVIGDVYGAVAPIVVCVGPQYS